MTTVILDKVIELLTKYTQHHEISHDTRIRMDLMLDSFDTIRLLVDLEDIFQIQIPIEVISDIETVGELADYITQSGNGFTGGMKGDQV